MRQRRWEEAGGAMLDFSEKKMLFNLSEGWY
jgi:hypothetical protein